MSGAGARRGYRGLARGSEAVRALAVGPFFACVLGVAVSGCSFSFPVASLISGEDTKDTTGSIAPKPGSPLSPELGVEDWRRAKSAMAVALDPQGNGTAVAWDNPESAMKGNFTPVGQPFVKGDEICRAFLATLAAQTGTSSLQGTACRLSGQEWAIKDVKPWRKPA